MSVKIVKNLSLWFQESARDLPWRLNPDPYRVWLSEIMLQQTQVATVLPYFERFLDAFPEVTDLADAPLDEVLKLWAGLGYYSRARNLHKGAQALSSRLRAGKGYPETREEWLAVPGVGEYTAGAVLSIAFNQKEALVDGNVVRVLSRLNAIESLDAKKTEIWKRSSSLVNQKGATPRILNQALMELGALICRPRNPDCLNCPVRTSCKGKGSPERYPKKNPKKKWKQVQERRWILITTPKTVMKVFLKQNAIGEWRAGLWDFPDQAAFGVSRGELVSEFKLNYVVTHHRVERAHTVFKVPFTAARSGTHGKWFAWDELPGVPAPVKKALLQVKRAFKSR